MDSLAGAQLTTQVRFTQAAVRNLHHEVADQIGMRIVTQAIRPGEKLPAELELCKMLGVSRTAIREAIRVLAAKGLVEARRRAGTKVRPSEHWNHFDAEVLRWRLDAADAETSLRKLFEVRFVCEPAAAMLAAANASEAGIRRIAEAFARMKASESAAAFAEADLEFHRSIYLACGNEYFLPMMQMLASALRKSFEMSAPGDHRSRAIAEHGALYEAIARRDPVGARTANLALLEHSRADIARMLGPEGGEAAGDG
jgi:DNA-binding FadR family transcriptional regulator